VRPVLDTCVLVAAIRSRLGTAHQVVQLGLGQGFTPPVSVPLVLEYEDVLTRPEHLEASGLSAKDAVEIVRAFCISREWVHLRYRLRPQLDDPADEFVLETAFHGKADAIVTFNRKHLEQGARRFGIEVLSPIEALKRTEP
jgi:predicted nucleic acid-binding protein